MSKGTANLFLRSDAHISDDGVYRWWLSRVWDETVPPVCWVMLNPSTADAKEDDPTIRRCIGFARQWGAGGIYVVNLFALRSTNPAALWTHPDPIGGNNNWAIRCNAGCAPGCDVRFEVVAAWGAHGTYRGRGKTVADMLRSHGIRVKCLGVTRQGQPKHPLYVAANTPLIDLP